MTNDKIKTLIDPIIYKFWNEELLMQDYETQKSVLFNAYHKLKKEINIGLLTDIKYHAELQLIKRLGGEMLMDKKNNE